MPVSSAKNFSTTNAMKLKTMLSVCPKKIHVMIVFCPAVSAMEVIESAPTAAARPVETSWLCR